MRKQIAFAAIIIFAIPLLALAVGTVTSTMPLISLAALVLALGVLMTAVYVGALYVLGTHREWLARCFTWVLLQSRVAHPVDSHPALADRLQALGVDPAQTVEAALSEMLQQFSPEVGLKSMEEVITTAENEWTRIPGRPFVVDSDHQAPLESAPGNLASS